MNISETFEHNPEHPTFKDFKKATPARHKLNPEHEEEHEHLKRLHGNYSWADQDTLHNYTLSSQSMNMYLTKHSIHNQHLENQANSISASITNNKPLEHDHHVYSGLGGFDPRQVLNHAKGHFENKHFISASIDPEVATKHDNLKNMLHGTDHSHIVHFYLPKGYDKGRYIAPVSEFAGEHEFLLDRDQKWEVHNSETIHTTHPLSGRKISKTIWSVKPHVKNINEIYKPIPKEELPKHFFADPAPGYQTDKAWEDSLKDTKKNYKKIVEHPDVLKQHKQLAQLHEPLYSERNHKAIERYTSGDTGINSALIRKAQGRVNHYFPVGQHSDMKNIFKKNLTLDHDVHAYSGLGFDPSKHFAEAKGVFHSPAYISSSLNPYVAWQIGNHQRDYHESEAAHVVHFHLPKGYKKAAYFGVKSNRNFKSQRELVLDHNQKFKLFDKTEFHNGETTVHVWHVKPHRAKLNLKEELEHLGKEYFDDAHPGLTTSEWDKKSYYSHPNPSQLEDHINDLTQRVNIKTAGLKPSEVEEPYGLHQRLHKAIAKYTRESTNYNDHLVNGSSPDYTLKSYKETVGENIDDTITKISDGLKKIATPVEHTIHTYSGTNHPAIVNGTLKEGSVFHTPAFTSTSIKHNIAKGFGWNHLDPNSDASEDVAHHIIHFELPANYSKGAYIKPHSWLSHEHEYLLDKNQHWKVTKHEVYKTRDPESKNYGKVIDRHVWTVIPYKPKNTLLGKLVKEALVHIPALFSRKEPSSDVMHPNQLKIIDKVHNNTIFQRTALRAQADAHHQHMVEHYPYDPSKEEKEVIGNYTRFGSKDINSHILKTPEEKAAEFPEFVKRIEQQKKNDKDFADRYSEPYNADSDPKYEHPHHTFDRQADELSKVITKHTKPLKEESHVYSGIGFDPSEHFQTANGVLHTSTFISTSLGAETPNGFGRSYYKPPERVVRNNVKPFSIWPGDKPADKHTHVLSTSREEKHIIHFKLPVGYKKGLYVAQHSYYPEEYEYLLNKDQKWKLEKHEKVKSFYSTRYSEKKREFNNTKHNIKDISKFYITRHIWTVVPHKP